MAVGQRPWSELPFCARMLDDAAAVAKILENLVRGTVEETLMAYQVAFDVCESDNQNFLARVTQGLPKAAKAEAPAAAEGAEAAPAAAEEEPSVSFREDGLSDFTCPSTETGVGVTHCH